MFCLIDHFANVSKKVWRIHNKKRYSLLEQQFIKNIKYYNYEGKVYRAGKIRFTL